MQNVLWTSMWAAFASLFCALLFNADKKDAVCAALLGGAGWFLYRLLFTHLGYTEAVGYMCGAFVIALASEVAASLAKNPATVYMLPALFPLVPGYGLFAFMRAVVLGETQEAADMGYRTLIAAGAIALGIAVATSSARLVSHLFRHKR